MLRVLRYDKRNMNCRPKIRNRHTKAELAEIEAGNSKGAKNAKRQHPGNVKDRDLKNAEKLSRFEAEDAAMRERLKERNIAADARHKAALAKAAPVRSRAAIARFALPKELEDELVELAGLKGYLTVQESAQVLRIDAVMVVRLIDKRKINRAYVTIPRKKTPSPTKVTKRELHLLNQRVLPLGIASFIRGQETKNIKRGEYFISKYGRGAVIRAEDHRYATTKQHRPGIATPVSWSVLNEEAYSRPRPSDDAQWIKVQVN